MAPSRRRGASKAAAAAAARRQWKVGDLVLAKVKGFPAWPATVSEPEEWGFRTDWKKLFVHFFGTQQIAFCNPADVEAFTEEKKQSLLVKRQGKGADFVLAVQEIIDSYEKLKETQADITNSGEVAGVNVTIPVDASAKLSANIGLKDETQDHDSVHSSQIKTLNSFTDQPETTYAAEEVPAVAPKDESSSKEASSKELIDNAGATAKSHYPVTYSSRKRSVDLRPQDNITQRNVPVQKSRSSSRIQSFVIPCSDVGKIAADGSASAVQNASLRRSKRSKKSPDISECDDVDPCAFASNDSTEDNHSEILTMDSDPLSLNEGSTMDSNCKPELSDTIECPGKFELNIGLDELNTTFKKKKRKPNRKRLPDGSAKQITTPEEEAGVLNSCQRSQIVCENPKDRCTKQDGDEHLPLLKRARVRMGKSSATDVEPNSLTESQDKRSEENSINSFQNIIMFSSHDNLSAAEGDLSCSNVVMDNVSPPKSLAPCSENGPQICKIKDQNLGCSVDGEAALPPSKRLHRALEAMSANAAEDVDDQDRAELSHNTVTSNNRCCTFSINRCPCTANNSQGENDFEMLGIDTCGNDSSHFKICSFSTRLNPVICNPAENKLSVEMDKQMTELATHEICKDVLPDGKDKEVDKELTNSGVCQTDGSDAQAHLLGNISPNPEIKCCEVGSSQDLSGSLLLPNDESNTRAADISNRASCLSEHIETDHGHASGANESGEFSTQNITHVPQNEFPQNTRCLKPAVDDSSNVNDIFRCEAVKDIICKGSKEDMNSVSISDDCCGEKAIIGLQPSPSLTDGGDCPPQGSPPNTSFCNVSTSDSSNILQNNGSCSPDVHLHQKQTFSGPIGDGKIDGFAAAQRSKNKSNEAGHAALLYFEATLGTLTRTKESIGRATRIAIDCAKFGSAAKVVDILAHSLETESSLHRRVDLFFLVDSIAQCSRGLKGDVGSVYPSAIQAVLPRLLSAVAPPGNTAQENRRQCLKVLRLWLERRILPESIIRHHIRELDYSVSAAAGAFSRRSLRTERALDDPVREMEGMLVDEYGSNSSFQLPGFCMPRMLKCEDDDGSDSDGGKFEAVTPEHNSEAQEVCEVTPALEKHRHILEDVDGELEMEDVAPSCDVEMMSADINGGNNDATQVSNRMTNNLMENNIPVSFIPPLPQDVPPSSPPLPLSSPPPPPPPPPQPPSLPLTPAISHPYSTGVVSKLNKDAQIVKDNSLPSVTEHLGAPRDNQPLHEVVHLQVPECRDMPMQLPESTSSFSSYPPPPDNFRYFDGATVHAKGYPLRPPHQVPSNQFSFVHGDQYVKPRREAPPPSYSNRHHSVQNMERENLRNNHDRLKPPPYDNFRERWRGPAPYSGSRYHDRGAPAPYGCHPYESARLPDHGWRFPHRSMNHRNSMPFRQFEDAIPMASRGPGYWRPR